MEMIPVESSNLKSVGYEPASKTLRIQFNTGTVYDYYNVPEQVFQNLLNAESKGRYFHAAIRMAYRYVRIN